MSVNTAAAAAYLIAALLFIRALAGLSKHETAKAGNNFGIAGMAVMQEPLGPNIRLTCRARYHDRFFARFGDVS